MALPIVLSHFQAEPLISAWQAGSESAVTSPDLGLSTVSVGLSSQGVEFPTGERLDWETVSRIAESENSCFTVGSGGAHKIQLFSEETNRLYTLYPTPRAPTMLVSGIPMHRIKGTNPWQDTLEKVKTIAPLTGRVLDTATGLGYTAIVAAETADEVITVELDPAATEIARLNPWSRRLFSDKIQRIIGDSCDVIEQFESSSFSHIIHDPPMFNLAGDLYSEEFYKQLFRVLRHGGKLFHYIGDLESKSGRNTARGVIRRLESAGFKRVTPRSQAFGVSAVK